MRIVTEYQTVPFYMCGDVEIHTFLQSRKIKYIEERFSTKSNKPYWVYESNEKLRLARFRRKRRRRLKRRKRMSTYQIMNLILKAKTKRDIARILNKNRVPVEKSKYC